MPQENLWALFHKTLKTSDSLHMLAGLCKDVFMFYETEPWSTELNHLDKASKVSSVLVGIEHL